MYIHDTGMYLNLHTSPVCQCFFFKGFPSCPWNFLKRLVSVIVALRNLNMNFGVRLAFDKGQATGPFVCGRENITQKDGTTAGPFGNGEKGSWDDFFRMRKWKLEIQGIDL